MLVGLAVGSIVSIGFRADANETPPVRHCKQPTNVTIQMSPSQVQLEPEEPEPQTPEVFSERKSIEL